ncbi:MAG: hydrogenase iron-sulfur subunit [Desulfobacteraceae bacterium]|jgi:coenzyme F420-reducing hydrogenase delta subunit
MTKASLFFKKKGALIFLLGAESQASAQGVILPQLIIYCIRYIEYAMVKIVRFTYPGRTCKRIFKKGISKEMTDSKGPILALFYCQNTPDNGEKERQALEGKYGKSLRLFPIPCSGRLDPLHLLRALEEFADAAYLITCPEGTCRYFEGNRRAMKRVERTRWIIRTIGLEEERVGLIVREKDDRRPLSKLAEEIVDLTCKLSPSPVHKKAA